MCDYCRYHLLLANDMPQAAQRWEKLLRAANSNDAYKAPARMLLELERRNNMQGPKELWDEIMSTDFDQSVGKPTW